MSKVRKGSTIYMNLIFINVAFKNLSLKLSNIKYQKIKPSMCNFKNRHKH